MGQPKDFFRQFLGLGLILSILLSWQVAPTAAANYGHADEFSLYMALHQHIDQDFRIHGLRIESPLATGAIVPVADDKAIGISGTVFVAKWDGISWSISFEGTHEFRQQLMDVPESMLPAAVKKVLDYEDSNFPMPVNSETNETGYKLPYTSGLEYKIIRAWPSGNCPHGSNAVDFGLPMGSTIVAARSGIVIDVIENSTDCGFNPANIANQIVIRHDPDDGYTDWYLHIAPYGAFVNIGDRVAQGQPIARSHQTGYTSGISVCDPGTCKCGDGTCTGICSPGPHLHFHILDSENKRVYTTFDDVGAVEGCESYVSGNISDQTAPKTVISISGTMAGSRQQYISPVMIRLTATDDLKGVAYVEYNLNNAGWVTYDQPIRVRQNGLHTIRYHAVDNFGNREADKTTQFQVDTLSLCK